MEECWDPDPEARLTAQCFLDNLEDIVRDHGHLPDSGKAGIVAIPEKDPTHPSVLNNAVHHLESNGLSVSLHVSFVQSSCHGTRILGEDLLCTPS